MSKLIPKPRRGALNPRLSKKESRTLHFLNNFFFLISPFALPWPLSDAPNFFSCVWARFHIENLIAIYKWRKKKVKFNARNLCPSPFTHWHGIAHWSMIAVAPVVLPSILTSGQMHWRESLAMMFISGKSFTKFILKMFVSD